MVPTKGDTVKVICIDDEKLALDFMTHHLSNIGDIQIMATFQRANEGLKFALEKDIDVIFLDIHMPEMDGLELAEQILAKKPYIDIVFVTAYNEYAVTAFDLNAIDYLLKHVKMDRLQKTVERLLKERKIKKIVYADEDKLHIRLGSNVSFSTDNKEYTPVKWRTAKARELFLYLLQNNNRFIHKGTLLELLWGEEELDRGYSILYTTVYTVRKALQSYPSHIELDNTNDGYILRLYDVHVDLHEWESQLIQLSDEIDDSNIDDFLLAMELNSGPYLEEFDYIWIEAEKRRLENKWIVAAQKIVDYYMTIVDYENAIKWLQNMVARVPELEEGHLLLMKIYAEQRKHHLVTKQYDKYVTIQQSYDLKPSPKVRKWFTDYVEAK